MKSKNFPRLLFALAVMCVCAFIITLPVHAQVADSSLVAGATGISNVLSSVWPFWAKIVAWAFGLSELMAIIPSSILPVNGWADILVKIVKAIGGTKKSS